MRLFRLSERLAACASLVRPGARLADVGSDHALLPVWLAKNGMISGGVATDISPNATKKAAENIAKYGVAHLLKAETAHGFDSLNPDEVDDIVIAGMGGELMGRILGCACVNHEWLKNPHYNLILQPMSHPERLRSALVSGGFEIRREIAVREGRRIYLVIQARYSGEEAKIHPYIGRLDENSDEASRDSLLRQAQLLRLEAGGAEKRGETVWAQDLKSTADEMESAANRMKIIG